MVYLIIKESLIGCHKELCNFLKIRSTIEEIPDDWTLMESNDCLSNSVEYLVVSEQFQLPQTDLVIQLPNVKRFLVKQNSLVGVRVIKIIECPLLAHVMFENDTFSGMDEINEGIVHIESCKELQIVVIGARSCRSFSSLILQSE